MSLIILPKKEKLNNPKYKKRTKSMKKKDRKSMSNKVKVISTIWLKSLRRKYHPTKIHQHYKQNKRKLL